MVGGGVILKFPNRKLLTLDCSVVMSQDATERYIKAVVNSTHWQGRYGALVTFMYPAIYRMTCRLDVRYFPYDQQNCTLTLGSWTSSIKMIDYFADFEDVNLSQYIASSEWEVISFKIFRHEVSVYLIQSGISS